MPFGDYEDFDACTRANSDKRDPEAYCATIKRQVEGAAALSDADREAIRASDTFSDKVLEEDPCWEDYVMVGTKTVNGTEVPNCVPEDEADAANMSALAAADDRCGEGKVRIGDSCVDLSTMTGDTESPPPSVLSGRTLAEFEEGDAVTWDWQGATVHGRVSEVRETEDGETEYVIDEYDDDEGGYQSGNVTKSEASLDESPRDLPDRSDDNMLSSPQHLTLKSLDTEPIERVDEGGDRVRYKSLKLLSPGVWSDAGSQTATYYPPDGIANLQAEYDESEYDGPPVNIMHDLDMDTFEAHEASVAGHIDPDTLNTDDEGNLFADIVFDTATGAGQFADENLQSTLENEGTVGFGGPSVEIPAEGLQQEHDPQRDMPRVDGGLLSGCAMVMDPASKSVNFAREAARRPVAMSASGESGKVLTHESVDMRTLADAGEIRETLGMFGLDTDDLDDEEVMDMAEDLHNDLMDELEGDDAEMGDYEDDDEDEEDAEMEEDEEEEEDEEDEMEMADDMETVMERVQNLSSRLEDVEDAVSQAMTAEDVDAELEDAAGNKLADAETVKTLKEAKQDLETRLEELEDKPAESKTLTDSREWEPNYDADTGASSGW